MRRIKHMIVFAMAVVFMLACTASSSKVAKVELKKNEAGYQRLYVNSQEFYVNGAGLEFGNMEALAEYGGNSFRTWRTRNESEDAIEVLDRAHKNGLMVLMGLDVARERHGFDYNDADEVKKQFEYLKGEVERLKDHPALLGWAIGNELNLEADNLKVYDAVEEISRMIHELDPNHPTTTTMAGIGKREVDYIKEHCTDIDFLSIQMYGDIVNLQKRIGDAGWEGPYMVTEWGATGHWEVARTEWDVAIEQTSREKAEAFIERYELAIQADPVNCLGSYVFLWAQKQERTPTWYGMFLANGNVTETVDAMQFVWTGAWPENRCPTLVSFILDGKTAYDNIKLKVGEKYKAIVLATDYENDPIVYRWEILPESTDLGMGGDYESRPETLLSMELEQSEIELDAPSTPGAYRLFIYATDNGNRSATANIPFFVEE
ncbi:MAG: hypothetical protein E4H10_03290 [Bacteroidia bacterium]|nr:MAG: hypothetical protein E4H10_03290 [Bacteroidia bacterium]